MKFFNFFCSLAVIIILVGMSILAFPGVSAALPSFVNNFEIFYTIFRDQSLSTIIFTTPLLISILFCMTSLSGNNIIKLMFLVIEIVCLVVIVLFGIGIIPGFSSL